MAKENAFSEIFNVLKKTRIPNDNFLSKIPSFMFCRYLGGHQYTIQAANIINQYYAQIPVDVQYKMVKQAFAGKGIYPKMIKNTPKDTSLDILCKHYKINREMAKEYKQFISDKQLNYLKKIYTING